MARRSRKRPYSEGHRPLDMDRLHSMPREVARGGATYHVQHVGGSVKTYTCPGCLHAIAVGTGHVVAWRTDTFVSSDRMVEARRHWHTACWNRNLRPNSR